MWAPQPGPQLELILATWCRVIMYGGARGGGKTSGLLGDYLQDVPTYEKHWQGIFIRQSYPELEEAIRQGVEMYAPTGAVWKEAKKTFLWPNGASLKMRHIENEQDANKYQGHQYTWIGADEVTNQPNKLAITKIFACNRWTDAPVPTKRIRLSGNPGGAGHSWVKSTFIDKYPSGYVPFKVQDPDIPAQEQFEMMYLPARVSDNPILLETNPGYIAALKMLGSPELVRAWLDGDWNVVLGAYFPEFSHDHIVRPFVIPEWWIRFRCIDWGTYHPFACLWIAVSDGSLPGIPKDTLVVYRELYGSTGDDKGVMWTAEEVAIEIDRLSQGEDISYTVADPSMISKQSYVVQGPSIAEVFHGNNVFLRAADNARLAGWQQLRMRLKNKSILLFDTCPNLIRTLPLQQHDKLRPEDLDTKGPDHLADALRYGLMSRPWTDDAPRVEPMKVLSVGDNLSDTIGGRPVRRITMDELWAIEELKNKINEKIYE